MTTPLLRNVPPASVAAEARDPVDDATRAAAREIVDDVRARGEPALRAHAERLGDLAPGAPLTLPRAALDEALAALPPAEREVLERTAERIARFARAQREALQPMELAIPGGRAGQEIAPVERAGCYAPGGRFPLPSSVLMTAVTARTAGVERVWVASPRPAPVTLAAAAVAGADGLLAVGGAQAIAALAFGAGPVPACDVVVGPGNRWVTAAKQLVAGRAGVDLPAGPSELVVLADDGADPSLVAADLLAQAEHDPEARPILVGLDPSLPSKVDAELRRQLADLPTADTARRALGCGFAVVAADLAEACRVCDLVAPEHLELQLRDPEAARARLRHWGGLFVGAGSAEVLGDYGAGPNHTLPTGGTARWSGGLSVLHFLRVRTWLRIEDPAAADGLARDAERLARMEGLEAHARAARRRRGG
jgi:phosphoribosyl-ATP pyrophosphohydrolase/phosphoribosyl-AMP cyclohydrolase/histidinol dehydrogenase